MKVKINSKEYEYPSKITLEEISKDFEGEFFCGAVNNRLRELTYCLDQEGAEEIGLLEPIQFFSAYAWGKTPQA